MHIFSNVVSTELFLTRNSLWKVDEICSECFLELQMSGKILKYSCENLHMSAFQCARVCESVCECILNGTRTC